MASTDAIPVPRKNVAYRLYFRINDSNGDPAAGVSSLAAEVSKDGASFASSSNTPVEVGNGVYYIDLTAAEMNADFVAVRITSSAKETQAFIYPEEEGDYRIDPSSIAATVEDAVWDADRVDHTGAGTLGEHVSSLDDASEVAAAVWDEDATGHQTAGTFGEALGDPAASGDSVRDLIGALNDFDPASDTVTVGTNNDKTGYRLSAPGVDDILDEAIAEPSSVFAWPGTLRNIVGWLGALARNKITQTSTTQTLRDDADSNDIATASVTDDGSTTTRSEYN